MKKPSIQDLTPLPALALVLLIGVQALPPPRDGDIRVLYHDLQKQTVVWLTLEPRLASGTAAPPLMLVTLSVEFPGKKPKGPLDAVEMRAYAGLMWAPRPELALAIEDEDRVPLLPAGVAGLITGGVSDYAAGQVALAQLERMTKARRVRIFALGLELELTDSQREAVGAFLNRVRSDDPARFGDK